MVLPPCITPTFFEDICQKNGLVLDTNMLLLYLIGIATDGNFKNCPRVKDYTFEDFQYVTILVEKSKDSKLRISPHSITETLYLLGIDPRKSKEESAVEPPIRRIKDLFDITVEALKLADESIYTDTPSIVRNNKQWHIEQFGVPDLSFKKSLIDNEYAFLSSDETYASHLYDAGVCAASLKTLNPSPN